MQIISVEQRVYEGSIGITIDLTCKNYSYEAIDLEALKGPSGTAQILIQQPDATILTKTATITGDNHDTLRFISEDGDFDVAGIYSLQGKIFNSSITVFTEPVELQVRNLFDEEES